MVMSDSKAAVLSRPAESEILARGRSNDPVIHRRGPEVTLKLDREDEHTQWKRVSEDRVELILTKRDVFCYESRIVARGDTITVDSKLINQSSWDWQDAYVYFHWGLKNCPSFADDVGNRTMLFTTHGPKRVSELRRRLWSSTENAGRYDVQPCDNGSSHCFLFRPTAQYFEPEERPVPKTEDGFKFDMCGISPDRVNRGLGLRLAREGDQVLAMAARRFRHIFVDMSDSPKGSQCIHVDPTGGDLRVGHTVALGGFLCLLKGTVEETTREALRRQELLEAGRF